MDYSDVGLDANLNKVGGKAALPSDYEMAINHDIRVEKNPIGYNTLVAKNLLQTTSGGTLTLKDKTGGTTILTYNPSTGVVTISGSLIANAGINVGTLTNSLISGTTTVTGTVTGSGIYSGGTFNNVVMGTSAITGGTATNTVITSGTVNNSTLGTPNVTAGTFSNPKITGTENLAINTGTAALTNNGDFAVQTLTGSAILVIRAGGTNFFFSSGGTF